MSKHLHIVSFDIPLPANYGGVIDVFYKLKALSQLGVKIHLHCFYKDRQPQIELQNYCESVSYYPRQANLKTIISKYPFVVKSRSDKTLLEHLNQDNYPILFEGLHCTFPLLSDALNNRKTLVRAHNIEHRYYQGLANSESNLFKKCFFKLEARKLKPYQRVLQKATYVLSIAPLEHQFLNSLFKQTYYSPVFHQNTDVKILSEFGKYALYVGDLRIADNQKAALFLIDVFKDLDYPLRIASSFSNATIEKRLQNYEHIKFVKIKSQAEADTLLAEAHLNVMLTFQNTGIKLKLINTLFAGRFCLTNSPMVTDTGLESLCQIADTPEAFRLLVIKTKELPFTKDESSKRKVLLADFSVLDNAQKIVDLL